MKRTWTIIGVRDVPGSLKWYQALFGQPETPPAHDHFGQILDTDGTVLLCLHQWGAHEHPSLMSPDEAPPGNGLLLFFRVDDFDMALEQSTRSRHPPRRRAAREPEHSDEGILGPGSGRILRHDECALCVIHGDSCRSLDIEYVVTPGGQVQVQAACVEIVPVTIETTSAHLIFKAHDPSHDPAAAGERSTGSGLRRS